MGPADEPLKGFSWRSGTKRDTTGIIMWSDVFLHTLQSTGEKIAIVVVDTQGLFDNDTSPVDNSRIFALGTLISSIQILNLTQLIQEDQLQYLQFAIEFAKFAAKDNHGEGEKPFQNLLFLIRDWVNPEEFEFGHLGGDQYLKEILKIKPDQKADLKSVRQFILESFDKVNCYLMPHPGKHVVRQKDNVEYDGSWKMMDEEFKDELVIVIEKLLGEENLVLKKIDGKNLKASEFKEYMVAYFKLFESDELPQALSIYESTIERQMSMLITKCLSAYNKTVDENQHLFQEDNIHVFHEMSKSKTLIMFKDAKKMGNAEHEKKYKVQLEAEMEKLYVEWKDRSLKHLQQLREERERTEAAVLEKVRLEQEALEKELKSARQRQAELEESLRNEILTQEKIREEGKNKGCSCW